MRLEAFALERWQSIWEHRVAWNLSDSGVHPLRLDELLDTAEDRSAILAQELAYTQTNGTPDLRALHLPPEAGAIALIRYHRAVNSTALVERLRDEQRVLAVPGDHFDRDGHLRIGFGSDPAYLSAALGRIGDVLDRIPHAG